MSEHDALDRLLRDMAPPLDPPAGLTAGVMAAVARAAADAAPTHDAAPSPSPSPASRWRSLRVRLSPARVGFALAGGLAVVLAALLLAGRGPGGTLELDATLRGAAATAQVSVRALGTGRDVHVTSATLPEIPASQVYELWFVSPDGRRRISGGTFHPDAAGRTDVHLHAAADPAKYPRVEVTLERSGGDPAASGDVVLAR